jgi:hypothetical protein
VRLRLYLEATAVTRSGRPGRSEERMRNSEREWECGMAPRFIPHSHSRSLFLCSPPSLAYRVTTAPPHVYPLPNAANSTFDPLLHLPSLHDSDRPMGIVAAVVLPYFSMFLTVFSSGIPSF